MKVIPPGYDSESAESITYSKHVPAKGCYGISFPSPQNVNVSPDIKTPLEHGEEAVKASILNFKHKSAYEIEESLGEKERQ